MPNVNEHGGGCCGIQHINEFPSSNVYTPKARREMIAEAVAEAISEYDDDDRDLADWRCALEVVLAEYQIPGWRKPLEDSGFREVFSFLNDNSGNRCYVFYLETNKPAEE